MDLVVNSGVAGELSPKMKGRSDLPEYHQGCSELTNVVVEPGGGMMRRPGFEFIAAAYSSTYYSRLIAFVKGKDRYILEFSEKKMRVFKDGEIVMNGGSPYALTTVYANTSAWRQVRSLQFGPGGREIYHPFYYPYTLVCEDDGDWSITAEPSATRQYGPYQDENKDQTLTIKPSGVTGEISLTVTDSDGTDGVFDTDHVGAPIYLVHDIDEQTVAATIYDTATSSSLSLFGEWKLTLSGRWAARVQWQRSTDDGSTWKTVREYYRKTPGSATIEDKGEETELNVLYRLVVTWIGTPDPPDNFLEKLFNTYDYLKYEIKVQYGSQIGIAVIKGVTTSKLATATVALTLGATTGTYKWALGAWNGVDGYPGCGTVHDGRIFCAGGSGTDPYAWHLRPLTLWAGKPFLRFSDERCFDVGTTVEDDDAIARTIDRPNCHEIRWLSSQWPLLIGCDGAILKAVGAGEDQPITPLNCNFIPQNGVGAAAIQPVDIAGRLAYVGRTGKSVYELQYSDDKKQYSPLELTRYREHICGSGIVEWAVQQQPYQIVWAVTEDGDLIGLTRYQQSEEHDSVIAWHRHTTDGVFESVAVLPGDAGEEDEVWVVVARTVDGATYRTVERMKPFDWGTEQRDAFFVDSGTTWDGGAAVTITDVSIDGGTGKVTVTAAAHGFSDGYKVKITGVAGTTDLNGRVYTVSDKATNTFILKTRSGSAYIDGSAFGAYTSGGSVERVINTVTGLTQLAGETVSVLLDGQPATGTVNSSGVYTIGSHDRHYYNTIHIGRDYDWAISPMRPEVRTVNGSIQAVKRKIVTCMLRLYRSAGGQVGAEADGAGAINYAKRGDVANAPIELVSEDVMVDFSGGWDRRGDLWVGGDGPLPFHLSAIFFGMEA